MVAIGRCGSLCRFITVVKSVAVGWLLCINRSLWFGLYVNQLLREKNFKASGVAGLANLNHRAKVLSRDLQISLQIVHMHCTVWSIVRPGRPKHLDGRTTTFETFGRTDYVVGT